MAALALVFLLLLDAPPARSGDPAGLPENFELLGNSKSTKEQVFLWKPLTFKKIPKRTRYEFGETAAGPVVQAASESSAGGLYRKIDADPREFPVLRWKWRVEKPLEIEDEKSKEGDDFIARIYVTFRYDPNDAGLATRFKYGLIKRLYGEYPPEAAVNYVWASREPKESRWENPYASQAMMLAVQSGAENADRWVSEERNVYDDYRNLFGKEPPPISGVAVMTDTDNTGQTGRAWYAQIGLFKPGSPAESHE